MSSLSWRAGLASIAILGTTAYAVAQMSDHAGMHHQMGPTGSDQPMMSPQGRMPGPMPEMMQTCMRQMMQSAMAQGHAGSQGADQHGMMMGMHGAMAAQPTMPGQDAFGAIQEVVQILEADPTTDWSKVNIAALREHLIDMNELTLHAVVAEQTLDNGIEVAVTGQGRTLEAIKRMVPAQAGELVNLGWNATTQELPNGVKLIVTTADAKQVPKLKALGFLGIMVQGAHHQAHHLMTAKGEFTH
jgi:hypothetical protein